MENNLGWVEKIQAGGIKILYFSVLSHSLDKLLIPSQNFAFSCKDICVLSKNQLSSHKHFLFTLQLVVVRTAPSFSSSYILDTWTQVQIHT